MVPQNLPALTTQEGVGVGLMEMEVEVVFEVVVLEVEVVDVVFEVLVVLVVLVLVFELVALVVDAPPGTRYQFAWGSLRHSPAVTPFQPLDWIRPK